MTLKTGLGLLIATGFITAACSTTHNGAKRGVAGKGTESPFEKNEARPLKNLLEYTSVGPLTVKKARVITDNFKAYESKLAIVNSAKTSLRMVYYIFSDDQTSSEFTNAVIAAAKRGVKVTLLVDFLTNYGRIDLFKYMESKGKENIKIYFYGLPAKGVLEAAIYQTIPCSNPGNPEPNACAADKQARMAQMTDVETTWFSRMYLTGFYGRNQNLLQTSVGLGGQVDPAIVKGKYAALTPEDRAKLKPLAKTFVEAKFKGSVSAKLKLNAVLSAQGTPLVELMSTVTGIAPLALGGSSDVEHMTDYAHHKLIVADGERFQMGGRNIEDSYHTDGVSKKYTFMDTDFYAESVDTHKIEERFDALAGFGIKTGGLVGDMADVERLVPSEYDINTGPFLMALQECITSGAPEIEDCVNKGMIKKPGYLSLQARLAKVSKGNQENAGRMGQIRAKSGFQSKIEWREGGNDAVNDPQAQVYYLENTVFNRTTPNVRTFDSKIGQESATGKNIHAAWIRGIENTCAVAAAPGVGRKRIVLHSAYLLMSSGLLKAIGKTLDGTWNCANVDVQIITNSFATTDLNILNVFARYQLSSLFKYYWNNKRSGRNASLAYSEYLPLVGLSGLDGKEMPSDSTNQIKSLHTKVSVLGDDIIIGSANADVRSYFMDTNNAVMIRNAPNLVADYLAFIDRISGPSTNPANQGKEKFWLMDGILGVNDKGEDIIIPYATEEPKMSFVLDKQNEYIVKEMQMHWDKEMKHLTPEVQKKVRADVSLLGKDIQASTDAILKSDSGNTGKSLEEIANAFDKKWMAL